MKSCKLSNRKVGILSFYDIRIWIVLKKRWGILSYQFLYNFTLKSLPITILDNKNVLYGFLLILKESFSYLILKYLYLLLKKVRYNLQGLLYSNMYSKLYSLQGFA